MKRTIAAVALVTATFAVPARAATAPALPAAATPTIAACALTDDGSPQIYVGTRSTLHRLLGQWAMSCAPAWSPDGRWLAFEGQREGAATTDVYVMSVSG